MVKICKNVFVDPTNMQNTFLWWHAEAAPILLNCCAKVFMLKSEIAAAQGILSKEIHLSCSTRKLANHELLKDLEGED